MNILEIGLIVTNKSRKYKNGACIHLHAGSPTVSKNRQVPPFMQKSPAIGQGCSCLGHAAVALRINLFGMEIQCQPSISNEG
ncbi:hypothetical protein V1478_011902, partial [Vespula squamosa]